MEPGHSLFSRLTTFQTTVLIVVAVLVAAHVVVWWFKPEPKTVGMLVSRCLLVVGVGLAVLYFVKPRGHEFELLKRDGVRGTATVLKVQSTNVTIGRRPQVRLQMRVEVGGKPAYELTHVDLVGIGQAVIPGRRLAVYVDRNQPDKLVIDWAESTEPLAETPKAAPPDVSSRLAELDRLRDRGQITEAEYAALRERVLSEL